MKRSVDVMTRGLVSIIMPAYNAENTIERSIETVLMQTYDNWELIIVNDCSKDNTLDVLEKYKDNPKIKVFTNDVNSRAAVTRNNGLKQAQGQYLAFLDSDHLWTERKLEKQIAFMNEKKACFAFTSYDCIDENDTDMGRVIRVPEKISAMELLGNTIIGCSTVLIDREQMGDFEFIVGNKREDMFTWHLLLKRGFVAYGMDEVMMRYRVTASSSSNNKVDMAIEYYKGLRDVAKLGFFKRSY
jgi:teichuronic acid biosynthesis glycosyltransferase TuaG